MNKTLYFSFLAKNNISEAREVVEAIEKRVYLIDRLLGSVRGMSDGKYKDTPEELIANVVDTLLSNGLINVSEVEPIRLTQIKG